MLKKYDFENLVWDLLFTYRQSLLHGDLHKNVDSEIYNKNSSTWNTLLLSLESGVVLGLAKLLEDKFFGRSFNIEELDSIAVKIENVRNGFIAHNDLSKMRNTTSFIEKNKLSGSDIIKMIDALKKRASIYEKDYNTNMNVQKLFDQTTRNAMLDLYDWLKNFSR